MSQNQRRTDHEWPRSRQPLVFLTTLVLTASIVTFAEAAVGARQHISPDSADELDATRDLIVMTQTGPLLVKNFQTMLEAIPGGSLRYDNDELAREFERRFGSVWRDVPLDARMQRLCWLAECNKRMLIDRPEVRARQRDALLKTVHEELAKTTDPERICSLLDVAHRTTFYLGLVTPQDGGDAVIDLFRKYIPESDPTIHDFACSKLRRMGYVWASRYDEVLEFLMEEAPELRPSLTAEPIPGVPLDPLLLSTPEATIPEARFLASDDTNPDALVDTVRAQLHGRRASDSLGIKALTILVSKACHTDGEEATTLLANLVRDNIKADTIVYRVSLHAAKEQPPADREATRRCLEAVLQAYTEIPEDRIARDDGKLPSVLLSGLRESVAFAFKGKPETADLLYTQKKLAATEELLKAREGTTETE